MLKKSRWKTSARYREYQRNYHKTYRVQRREYLLKYYREWKLNNGHKMLEYHYGISLGLTFEQFQKITEKCVVCGYREIVQCHHIKPRADGWDNNINNLMGLCPNHHALIHHRNYTLVKTIEVNVI